MFCPTERRYETRRLGDFGQNTLDTVLSNKFEPTSFKLVFHDTGSSIKKANSNTLTNKEHEKQKYKIAFT